LNVWNKLVITTTYFVHIQLIKINKFLYVAFIVKSEYEGYFENSEDRLILKKLNNVI